jgi:hypothetical protein
MKGGKNTTRLARLARDLVYAVDLLTTTSWSAKDRIGAHAAANAKACNK